MSYYGTDRRHMRTVQAVVQKPINYVAACRDCHVADAAFGRHGRCKPCHTAFVAKLVADGKARVS